MNKITLKNAYLFFFLVLVFFLHLPFAFSSSKKLITSGVSVPATEVADNKLVKLAALYETLDLRAKGLSENAYNYAIKGFMRLKEMGKFKKDNILTIVDFTKPSTEKRIYVIDVENEEMLFNTYCAHGRGSGKQMAEQFSNIPESFQSSLGFYETTGTYNGKNGYSMKLNGLEKGFNNKAEERAIVMHGAPYVSEGFIKNAGYLGRSWGCPALPEKLNRPIIDEIKDGSCLFIYSNNSKYLSSSKLLNS